MRVITQVTLGNGTTFPLGCMFQGTRSMQVVSSIKDATDEYGRCVELMAGELLIMRHYGDFTLWYEDEEVSAKID